MNLIYRYFSLFVFIYLSKVYVIISFFLFFFEYTKTRSHTHTQFKNGDCCSKKPYPINCVTHPPSLAVALPFIQGRFLYKPGSWTTQEFGIFPVSVVVGATAGANSNIAVARGGIDVVVVVVAAAAVAVTGAVVDDVTAGASLLLLSPLPLPPPLSATSGVFVSVLTVPSKLSPSLLTPSLFVEVSFDVCRV